MRSNYFEIYEFVSPQVYIVHEDDAWKFIDPRLIETMDFIKASFGKTITINDWWWKGKFTQRGLRDNMCSIVKNKTGNNVLYLSGHVLGMAVDFDVKGYTAEQVRQKLIEMKDLLPYPIRLEKNVSWVHLDMMDEGEGKIYIF